MQQPYLAPAVTWQIALLSGLIVSSCAPQSESQQAVSVLVPAVSPVCQARIENLQRCDGANTCFQLFFTSRSAVFEPEAIPILNQASQNASLRNARRIVVRGFSESMTDGAQALAIAEGRARLAARTLGVLGVAPERIEVQSHLPDCTGTSVDVQDRRVEIFAASAP